MTPIEFEDWLSQLTNEQYDALIKERILRLNPEQQAIAWAREAKRKERLDLIEKMMQSDDEESQERLYNALRGDEGFNCEHGRSYCKHCVACGEIDHLMFPEFFDESGFHIEESEED